jgi:hypothetical protein
MVTENEGALIQSSRTSISEFVNECSPGGGALDSKPHAAIISMIPCPRLGGAEAAAAQQSKRTRTSDLDFSNRLWIWLQSISAESRSRELRKRVSLYAKG